jgi:hypothetical protein
MVDIAGDMSQRGIDGLGCQRDSLNAKRRTVDDTRKTISQYRKFADSAKINAQKAVDADSRDWFLSLAQTMTALADALQEKPSNSN